MLNYLNREYAGDITGQLLEKEFGGNFDYMNRTFKKVTGQTIFRYLNRVRINPVSYTHLDVYKRQQPDSGPGLL